MRVFLYGDNVDTDVIIPARYLDTADGDVLARHCMEDIDPLFAGTVKPGDLLVAGRNFGCGSSREHAPLALRHCGLSVVIAHSFARIFFRNAINIGLPVLECPEAARNIRPGDTITVSGAVIENHTRGQTYEAVPMPPFVGQIVTAGGLLPYLAGRER